MRILYLCNSSDTAIEALEMAKAVLGNDLSLISMSEKVRDFGDYDLGISFLYAHRIPESELDKPWFNFHPAPLPECGGRNVAYHALANNLKEFGGTIHYMDEEFDTGPIIECKRFPIEPDDTAGDLLEKSHVALLELLEKYLPAIKSGDLPKATEQSNTTYYKQEAICDYIELTDGQKKQIRALTVEPKFFAKVKIGNRDYKIIPEEK